MPETPPNPDSSSSSPGRQTAQDTTTETWISQITQVLGLSIDPVQPDLMGAEAETEVTGDINKPLIEPARGADKYQRDIIELGKHGKPIGKGAYGEVFKLQLDDKAVAFKVGRDASASQALEEEAEIYEQLAEIGSHPNIVECYGIQEVAGVKGLAMEYIEGCEVNEILYHLELLKDQGNLKHDQYWGSIQYLTKDMLSALDHVQKAGLSHSDVKGSNMLFDKESGLLKLFDFGCATRVDEDEVRLNTPNYAAPEALLSPEQDPENVPKTNRKQDSFSVGQMVYRSGEGDSHFFGSDTNWGGGPGLAMDLGSHLNTMKEDGIYDDYKALKEAQSKEEAGSPGFFGKGGGKTAYVDFINSATTMDVDERSDPATLLDKPFLQDPLLAPEEAQALLCELMESIAEAEQQESAADEDEREDFVPPDHSDPYLPFDNPTEEDNET